MDAPCRRRRCLVVVVVVVVVEVVVVVVAAASAAAAAAAAVAAVVVVVVVVCIPFYLLSAIRGERLHTRNQHLRNHRGLSVAFSNGLSVAFSNGISLVGSISQRIVTCPVDFEWTNPMYVQCHVPMKFHFCDFWCVICCPEHHITSRRESL